SSCSSEVAWSSIDCGVGLFTDISLLICSSKALLTAGLFFLYCLSKHSDAVIPKTFPTAIIRGSSGFSRSAPLINLESWIGSTSAVWAMRYWGSSLSLSLTRNSFETFGILTSSLQKQFVSQFGGHLRCWLELVQVSHLKVGSFICLP